MEPTAAINAISFTVIVLSLLSIRRNKREMRRIEEARRIREDAPSRTITKVDASVLPTHVGHDGRAAQTHGLDVNVYLGKAVALDDHPPGAAGYQDFALGEVYDLEHRFDEGVVVVGDERWGLARSVVRQWTAAGLDALVLGADREPIVELWGTPGVRLVIGSDASTAAANVRAEIDRRFALLQQHGVNHLAALPPAVQPERLLVVWTVAPASTGAQDDIGVAAGSVGRLGRPVGVHLLVVSGSAADLTDIPKSVRLHCATVTSGFTSASRSEMTQVELDSAWDSPVPGRFTYDLFHSVSPFQAATCDKTPLPGGWSDDDLVMALGAGWTAAQIASAGLPTDEHRAAWQMLAALRG